MFDSGTLKLVVFGSRGVGKSSLTTQMMLNHYITQYDPQPEGNATTSEEEPVCDMTAYIPLNDFPSKETFEAYRDLLISEGEGFMLVFALDNQQSLQDIEMVVERIVKLKQTKQIPMLLVGNKNDLDEQYWFNIDQAVEKALELGIPLTITSAVTGHGVAIAFETILNYVYAGRGARAPPAAPEPEPVPIRPRRNKRNCMQCNIM